MVNHGLNFGINEDIDGLVKMVAQEIDDKIVNATDLLTELRVLGQKLADNVDNRLDSREQKVLELLLGIGNNSALWTEPPQTTNLADLVLPEVENC